MYLGGASGSSLCAVGHKKSPLIRGAKAWWPSNTTDLISDIVGCPKDFVLLLDIGSTVHSMAEVYSVISSG